MLSQSTLRVLRISWPSSIRTLSLILKSLLTHLLILSQSVSSFRFLSLRKTLNETCINMMTVTINTWMISVIMTETAKTEIFNLKKIEMISMTVFILTFLVKVNISLFIVSFLFLLQTVQFKALFKAYFLFVLWIRIPHLIVISSDLLIQFKFYHRSLLTINNCHCSLLIATSALNIIKCFEIINSLNKLQHTQLIRLFYQNLWYQLFIYQLSHQYSLAL